MNDIDFIRKKFIENRIKLKDVNENISNTYFKNSEDELIASKIMIKQKLFFQSITHSYYSMYLVLQSLLYKIGIKSEDHNSSIIILKLLFNINNSNIKKVKEERIQVQYYLKSDIDKNLAMEYMQIAENFRIEINNFMNSLNKDGIKNYFNKINSILNDGK